MVRWEAMEATGSNMYIVRSLAVRPHSSLWFEGKLWKLREAYNVRSFAVGAQAKQDDTLPLLEAVEGQLLLSCRAGPPQPEHQAPQHVPLELPRQPQQHEAALLQLLRGLPARAPTCKYIF